ncbi:glycosyltransferase family 8 protein [Devosia sp.]|uniref:glycosyltransferase family 8 protein n=1 Tax=Devosia sp. TaxID=1871048 RepID=UPI00326540C9
MSADFVPEQPSDSIHIALTFDDNFWAPTYATMRGICATTSLRQTIHFHLIHTAISDQHAERLRSIHAEYGSTVQFYDISRDAALNAKIQAFPKIRSRNLNTIVYARLFLCDIVPASVEKLIYIDGDILVRVPIEQFYTIDLGGNAIAAANCPHRVMFQSQRDLVPKAYFRTEDPYFNAGFLLIDTKKFRALDFAAIVEARVAPNQRQNLYYDQDILNIALRGNCKLLDTSWNFQNPLIIHESFDPKIVHYTGKNKPWRLFSSPAFKRQYRHTMKNDVYYQFARERIARRIKRLLRLA